MLEPPLYLFVVIIIAWVHAISQAWVHVQNKQKNMGTCLCTMPIDSDMGTCYDVITNKTTEQHSEE